MQLSRRLRAVLVLAGSPGAAVNGNLALDALLGAEIRWAGDVDAAGLDARVAEVAAELEPRERPFVVPFGGSNACGARGYRDCADEIRRALPEVRHVVTALGSGGTMAGLVAGLGPDLVLGVDVGALPDPVATVEELVEELDGVRPVGLRAPGPGGGRLRTPHPAVRDALALAARTEGLVLDAVYPGGRSRG